MAIREGRWDCSSCGRVANLGRDHRCGGCGNPRGKVKFYLPPNEPAVVEAERIAAAKAGPDWICGYCEASNTSLNKSCTGCGAPREEGKSRIKGGGDANEKTAADIEKENQAQVNAPLAAEYARKVAAARRKQYMGVLACVGVFVMLGCSGMFACAFPARMGGERGVGGPTFRFGAPSGGSAVELVSKTATRSITIEADTLVTEEGWCKSKPAGANELSRRSKQNGTRCVSAAPGNGGPILGLLLLQEDLGNGYFEDSSSSSGSSDSGSSDWGSSGSSSKCTTVAVYEDYCSWQVRRWIVVREPTLSDGDVPPPWPVVQLKSGEREGARKEVFTLQLKTADGETFEKFPVDGAKWMTLKGGERVPAKFSFFGGLKSLD